MFLGRANEQDLHALYRQCALFAMPSDGDGFGLVFLEAMMHGLPCVGQTNSAASEIFEQGKCGVLVDRNDVGTLAQTISQLLQDKEQCARIGQAGLTRYRSNFTGEHYSKRLGEILLDYL
jgi:glycosyltransferase involved in cell wall biosynthesis